MCERSEDISVEEIVEGPAAGTRSRGRKKSNKLEPLSLEQLRTQHLVSSFFKTKNLRDYASDNETVEKVNQLKRRSLCGNIYQSSIEIPTSAVQNKAIPAGITQATQANATMTTVDNLERDYDHNINMQTGVNTLSTGLDTLNATSNTTRGDSQ